MSEKNEQEALVKAAWDEAWHLAFNDGISAGHPLGLSNLDCDTEWLDSDARKAALTPPRQMVADSAQAEPVAWMFSSDVGMLLSADREWCEKTHAVAGTGPIRPLYSAPAPSASPAAHMGAEVVAWQRRVMDGDRPLSGWLHCDEWEVETQREHGNEVRALGLLAAPAPVASPAAVTEDMVSRFLGWRIPDDFAPDCGISFAPVRQYTGELVSWPIGTNLLTAIQARKMLEHVLATPPAAELERPTQAPEKL